MKNLTVTVSDEVYREARIRAAERGTSVSSLVSAYLESISDEAFEFARLERQQQVIQRGIGTFRAGDRCRREEIHDRSVH